MWLNRLAYGRRYEALPACRLVLRGSLAGLVLDDGTYWILYSAPGDSAVIAGAIQGNGTSSNGKDFRVGVAVNDARVLSLEAAHRRAAS
jgi:hypothetical protein